MKKSQIKFLFLITLMIALSLNLVFADKAHSENLKVPSVEKSVELKPADTTNNKSLHNIEPDKKNTLIDDSFWAMARNIGFGFFGFIALLFLFKTFKKASNTQEFTSDIDPELQHIIKEDEIQNSTSLDNALKGFIQRNL